MNSDAEAFFKSLEEQGEAKVRADLAANVYAQKKHGLVLEWLRRQDQSRNDSYQASQLSAARKAADAARDAADEAKKANRIAHRATGIAITAIVIATVSAIISLLS